jgi:hypothetical protein
MNPHLRIEMWGTRREQAMGGEEERGDGYGKRTHGFSLDLLSGWIAGRREERIAVGRGDRIPRGGHPSPLRLRDFYGLVEDEGWKGGR